jgi:serine/threonine protein kinase
MTLSPGTRLEHYEVLAPLGAGGMGEVYRARDTRLGRGRKWQISAAGGALPDWQPDGRRLYYINGDPERTVHAVDIDTRGGEIRIGSAKPLFDTAHRGLHLSAPAPDSRRILSIEPVAAAPTRDVVTVLVNWPASRIRTAERDR